MSSLSSQQLQSVISQIDQAISSHDHWYKQLLRVLIAHIPPESVDLSPDAHRRCHFGTWYASSKADFFRDHPAFVSLGDAHQKMHDCARALCQHVVNDMPVSLDSWERFDEKVEDVRLEFQALRREFVDMVQSLDPLTEALNRSSLLADLRAQQALLMRSGTPCTLIMIDLDHFKRVNDDHGHVAGDTVLVSIVQCLKTMLRPYDRIYRYGGEEFLLSMPGTTPEQATQVAERMRATVSTLKVRLNSSDRELHVTASFGIAPLLSNRTVEESIDHADKAMYSAKTAGRDRVVVVDSQ